MFELHVSIESVFISLHLYNLSFIFVEVGIIEDILANGDLLDLLIGDLPVHEEECACVDGPVVVAGWECAVDFVDLHGADEGDVDDAQWNALELVFQGKVELIQI